MRLLIFLALISCYLRLLAAEPPVTRSTNAPAPNSAFINPNRTYVLSINLESLFLYYKGFENPATAPPHKDFPDWCHLKGKVLNVTTSGVVFTAADGKTSLIQNLPNANGLKPGDEFVAVARKLGYEHHVFRPNPVAPMLLYDHGSATRFLTREEMEGRIEAQRRLLMEHTKTNQPTAVLRLSETRVSLSRSCVQSRRWLKSHSVTEEDCSVVRAVLEILEEASGNIIVISSCPPPTNNTWRPLQHRSASMKSTKFIPRQPNG